VLNAKITQLGIDIADITQTLQEQNIVLPGGRLDVSNVEIIVETLGRFKSVEEIGEVLIPISGTEATIPLRDIAAIRKAYEEPINNPAYYNGHQAIVLSVFILSGVDAVKFGERLQKEVTEIEQSLPWGYVCHLPARAHQKSRQRHGDQCGRKRGHRSGGGHAAAGV